MPLSKNPKERKKVLRAVVALSKLPPAKRRAILQAEMKKRGLGETAQA